MKWIVICLLFYLPFAFSEEIRFEDAYQKGKAMGLQRQNEIKNYLKKSPQSIIPNFSDAVLEKNYYQQNIKEDSDLKISVQNETTKNKLAQTYVNNHANRPNFEISKNSKSMNMNQWILDNSYDLTHNKKCTEIPACETKYENKLCFDEPKSIKHVCEERLIISVQQNVDEKHYPIIVTLHSGRYYMAALINLMTGAVIDHGPRDSSASIQGVLPRNIDRSSLAAVIKSSNLGGSTIKGLGYQNYGQDYALNIQLEHRNKDSRISASILIDFVLRQVSNTVTENWTSNCQNISKGCSLQDEICTEGQATKLINGLPITKDCWAKRITFICEHNSGIKDTCEPLINIGCEQISSHCEKTEEDQCVLFKKTFRCATKDCTYQKLCTDIPKCINGDCSTHDKNEDKDFNQAAGSFAALMSAGKSMDKANQYIFSGKPMSCSKAPIGYLNCCGDGGWGEILNDKCDEEEKILQDKREKHVTIEIPGEYCGKEIGGVCILYKRRYCVFTSKIARLIQEEGRLHQLGRSFGEPENPNCNGITPEELQKIDFSRINFSEVAEDIKNAIPIHDQAALISRINKNIQETKGKINAQ